MKYLNDLLKKYIKVVSLKGFPNESGGVLVDNVPKSNNEMVFNSGVIVIFCKNVSNNPKHHFLVSQDDYETARKTGKIVGFWHSHALPSDGESLGDVAISEKLNINAIVYKIPEDEFIEYEPVGLEIPYEGRGYFPGVLDCGELCVDYYKRELNVEIRCSKEMTKLRCFGPDFLGNKEGLKISLETQGFQTVNNLKEHDLILIKPDNSQIATHIMIYLGKNKILHHPLDDLSEISIYGRYWKERTKYIMRHFSQF